MKQNPFVPYLNRYTTVSSEHEAAFDEFITQAQPPSGEMLRLDTKIETFLSAVFSRERPTSIILTGNAGDGKTYLCRQIATKLNNGRIPKNWDSETHSY
jgi:DNA replication protein DnaC